MKKIKRGTFVKKDEERKWRQVVNTSSTVDFVHRDKKNLHIRLRLNPDKRKYEVYLIDGPFEIGWLSKEFGLRNMREADDYLLKLLKEYR